MAVELRLLGTTQALRDGVPVDLGGPRPTELLALLAAADGRVVPAGALAEQLWRGDPPPTAPTTLQGHVARLRRRLEPGTPARDAAVVVSRGGGYALVLPRHAVDVHRLEDRLRDALADLATGAAPEVAGRLRDVLTQWSGRPFADVADVPAVEPLVARLEELRLLAVEELAQVVLATGDGPALVPDLLAVAAEHPLRERTQALLARALHQGGRQGDALAVLRATRERLADELGVDPSPDLRDLERALLRQDPALRPRTSGARTPAADDPGRRDREDDVGGNADLPADGFVGRAAELSALDSAWRHAAAGATTAVVVTGEPGIGKTRLVDAFAARRGLGVRWGRCSQVGGAPPYWPWQQVLGGLPPLEGGDAGGRFAVGVEITRRLAARAADGPLLVALDDLQWADPDSLRVLEIVLTELRDAPVLLALTCREEATGDPAVGGVLALAARRPGARRLLLGGLDEAEVGQLSAVVTGRTPDAADARDLARRSAGHPFFVAELAALAGTTPEVARSASGTPQARAVVPAGVRDVLRLRLRALPADARAVLEAVAVAGDTAVGIVAGALGEPAASVGTAASAAVRAGLLVEPAPGRLRPAHDLVRDVTLGELDPGRRAALHRGLADALGAGAAAATSAAAIAVHRSEAALGAVDADAARACLRAAQEALDRAGDADAADLAARGLRHVPGADLPLVADLDLTRGRALRRLGLLEDSSAALASAADAARAAGDDERLARAALASAGGGLGGYWASVGAPAAVDRHLLAEAAARADRLDPDLRAQVLAAWSVHRSTEGHPDGEQPALAAEAAAGQRPSARARATVARFVSTWTPAHAQRRVDLARALLADADDDVTAATALHLLRCALTETVRPDEAAAVSRRFTDLAARRGDGDLLLLDLWVRSGTALAQGSYGEARRLADDAVATAPTVSPAAADVTRMSRQTVEGIIAWHERRLPEVVPDVVDLAATVDPGWLGVLAQAHAQAGRREAALAAADRLLEQPGAGVREPVRTVLLTDVYLELGDAERAAGMLPALRSYGDTVVVLWAGTTILGPVSLYRGGVLALLGDPAAEAELARAVEVCDLFGFRPFARRARRLAGHGG
ncbi:AfsR/SARP family transcriptional regulator [Cellulomonas aerilata]|uniref:OmpR/PhoB-type domain-containing protein n=1 Tax=Cellulomonas aerilata TaxID=515326 RepID=A0A512D9H3_9CELL|nr:AfsR/SARP family transcriptional regulator [Cellulomonas aerilata]GEO33144.1 hypothetical protein CAE01nite_08690 [Cellulomonas aerilata]